MKRNEWQRLVNLRPFIHYTKEEVEFFKEMATTYAGITNVENCTSCSGKESNLKVQLYSWFTERQDALLREIEEKEAEELAIKQVEDYKNGGTK